MIIPSGTHVAKCSRCGGVVGVSDERMLRHYIVHWRRMDVDVSRHDGDPVEMMVCHDDGCPSRFAGEPDETRREIADV